jgi:hypothetical protein
VREETKRGGLAGVLGAGVWLLPAWGCPVCLAAFAGTMSSLGLGFVATKAVLTPLTALLLGVAVVALGYGARRRRRYEPLILGVIGAAVLVASKFLPDQPWLSYAGLAALVGASLWNVRIGAPGSSLPSTAARSSAN